MKKLEIGQKLGKLTILEFLPNRRVRCLCDCGKETETPSYNLTRSKRPTRSCGKGVCASNFTDLNGKVFGYLTVLNLSEKQNKGKNFAWDCLCICGKITSIRAWNLTSGSTQSCGCKKSELISKSNTLEKNKEPYSDLFRIYKKSAKERNLLFSLSIEEFKNLISQNCYYCDLSPSNRMEIKNYYVNENIYYNGIDRKDNNIGYILENCLPCCKYCNYSKRELSFEEFINRTIKMADNLRNKL